MIHYIYCYTNLINGKQYIGQTNNLENRKRQHIQDTIHQHHGHEAAYQQPIHCAMRKYGIDNFKIDVLDIIDTDDWNQVNELEQYYIKRKNTMSPNGYNLQGTGYANPGRNKSKIPEKTIEAIYQDLKNKKPMKEIAEQYNLSRAYISDINNGRCLRRQDEAYPLQQNRMTNDDYYEIFDLLLNTNWSMREIARYTHRNRDTIEKINKGHQKIVQALYNGSFPIRDNARQGYTLKPVETISGETESRVIIDT